MLGEAMGELGDDDDEYEVEEELEEADAAMGVTVLEAPGWSPEPGESRCAGH